MDERCLLRPGSTLARIVSCATTVVLVSTILFLSFSPVCADDRDGRLQYLRYCASCHGDDARGMGRVAPALAPPPTDLTTLKERSGGSYSTDKLAAFIDGRSEVRAHGARAMPVWGTLLRQEFDEKDDPEATTVGTVRAIAEYLGTIQKGK